MPQKTRILGIDPGTSLIGFGIIDFDGKNYKTVKFGVFKTKPNIKNRDKVASIFQFFDNLIKEHRPDQFSIENLFFFKNAKTVMAVSEIRGVLLLAAASNNLIVSEFTPLQVKQAVCGYGRAEKNQIQTMVKLILKLKTGPPQDDTADALALAICCANTIVY